MTIIKFNKVFIQFKTNKTINFSNSKIITILRINFYSNVVVINKYLINNKL